MPDNSHVVFTREGRGGGRVETSPRNSSHEGTRIIFVGTIPSNMFELLGQVAGTKISQCIFFSVFFSCLKSCSAETTAVI